MKKFQFSLGRMLNFQQQNLQKEKNLMGQMMEEKRGYDRQRERMTSQLEDIHAEMDEEIRKGTTIFQIRAFTIMIENGKLQLEGIKRKLQILEAEIERQREVVVEASREVTKLEKLRDKKLEEYRYAEAKEQENTVSEHVSGKFVRESVS